MSLNILVVDDDRMNRETTAELLSDAGYSAEAAENAFVAMERLEDQSWDVVLTDLRMPGMDGLEFLKKLRGSWPEIDVILMTAYGTVQTAVNAMQEGAVDFLTKPISFQELDLRLQRLAEARGNRKELRFLKAALEESEAWFGLVGGSAPMRRVYERIELFSDNDAHVLIIGETGTGKELVSRALHANSRRCGAPFVPVACGAIPRDLAESELFGHEKGAFTGAFRRQNGSFEQAHRGTLLLDDVDDLPVETQGKLLRVLQDGTLRRVGGSEEIEVDVRVVATSKRELSEVVSEGGFRDDLFYRLSGLVIKLPPLRERGEDILLLAAHFLRLAERDPQSEPRTLSPETAGLLRGHPWKGNVRELKQVLISSMALCPGPEILPRHLPETVRQQAGEAKEFTLHLGQAERIHFNSLVEQFEKELIEVALRAAGGEQQGAAEILGLPRTTLQSKVARLFDPDRDATKSS